MHLSLYCAFARKIAASPGSEQPSQAPARLSFWPVWFLAWFLLGVLGAQAGTVDSYAAKVSGLIAPGKLATLGVRGANPRVYKFVALLAEAEQEGVAARKVTGGAVAMAGMRGDAAKLTAKAMLRNLTIARRLGCLDQEGLNKLRQGKAPTIHRGPYKGEEASVDHIIPRAVVPELDNTIVNLELLPLSVNERKNAKIGARQADLGHKLYKAGLLSAEGWKALNR